MKTCLPAYRETNTWQISCVSILKQKTIWLRNIVLKPRYINRFGTNCAVDLGFNLRTSFFKIGKDFLIKTQKAPIIKRKSDKLDYIKTKDQDTALPQQGAQVQFLVGELRAHIMQSVAKKEREAFKRVKM